VMPLLAFNREPVRLSTQPPQRENRITRPTRPLINTVGVVTPVITPTVTIGRCYIM